MLLDYQPIFYTIVRVSILFSASKEETDSFNQLLNKEDSSLDTSLIMYAEQLARKDVEINSLRAKDCINKLRRQRFVQARN